MKKLSLLFLILTNFATSHAFADYISDANAINSSANPKGSINSTTAQNVIPNYNSNPSQTNYYNNPSAMDSDSRSALQTSDSGKVAQSAFNNKGDYNLSYLPKDNSSTIDVSSVIKLFTGAYSDCQPTTTNNPTINTSNVCDQYYQVAQNSCQINREIQVFSSYTYSCTKDLIYNNKNCNKVLSIKCDANNPSGCDSGGIILTSIQSDLNWTYNYPTLMVGSIGDNYWSQRGGDGGSCSYYRSITFNVRDVSTVPVFNLRSVAYDDQILLKINGNQIFVGPNGSISGCPEYGRTWSASPNVNLIPYLRNGSNTIEMTVRVGGRGEAWFNIEARQNCCANPQEVWTEVCQ